MYPRAGQSSSTPAAPGAANTSTFLIHCLWPAPCRSRPRAHAHGTGSGIGASVTLGPHGVVGVSEQLAVAGGVAVGPQLDGGAASVALVQPGVEPPDLLRSPAVGARQLAGAPTIVGDGQLGAEHGIDDAEARRQRTQVHGERRRHPHDGVSLLVMRLHAGEHVVAQPLGGERGGELVGVTLDVGHRTPGEHGVHGQCLEAIAIPPQERRGGGRAPFVRGVP